MCSEEQGLPRRRFFPLRGDLKLYGILEMSARAGAANARKVMTETARIESRFIPETPKVE